MKKIKFLLLIFLLLPICVFASSGTIKVSGAGQVVAGNNVTFTVTLVSGTNIGSWQMSLNYDKKFLSLVSTNSEAGGVNMVNSSAGIKSKSYTFTFKALKTGSTSVKVDSYLIYDNDMNEMQITSAGRNLKIITLDELIASYSKDNYLKNLTVEGFEISPEFDKNTLEYSVIVPEDTKTINITAVVNDNNSSVTGEGNKEVSLGNNKFDIVVKAQNGDEKTYILNVDVKDSNPIYVDYDNKKYSIIKIKDNLVMPHSYEETTVKINDFDIPAFINKIVNYTLVGLKDETGNINLFKYENGKYEKYLEITSGNITVIPKKIKSVLKGYKKSKVTINENEIECLTLNDNSRFKVINGLDVYTNEEYIYLYDSKTNNLINYDEELFNTLNNKTNKFLLTTLIFMGTTILSSVCLVVKRKKKKKTKVKKEKANIKSEVTSQIENISEDVYDIFEDNKNSKKK